MWSRISWRGQYGKKVAMQAILRELYGPVADRLSNYERKNSKHKESSHSPDKQRQPLISERLVSSTEDEAHRPKAIQN
jgi:hypothetical protein